MRCASSRVECGLREPLLLRRARDLSRHLVEPLTGSCLVADATPQLYVDFNDRVKKGQLLARIDPTLQQQAVLDAQAGLERSDAELAQARREYERNAQRFDSRVLAAAESRSRYAEQRRQVNR